MKFNIEYLASDMLISNFCNQLKTGYQFDLLDCEVTPIVSLHKFYEDKRYGFDIILTTMNKSNGDMITIHIPLFITNNEEITKECFQNVWQRYLKVINPESNFMTSISDILKVHNVKYLNVRKNAESFSLPVFDKITLLK